MLHSRLAKVCRNLPKTTDIVAVFVEDSAFVEPEKTEKADSDGTCEGVVSSDCIEDKW